MFMVNDGIVTVFVSRRYSISFGWGLLTLDRDGDILRQLIG